MSFQADFKVKNGLVVSTTASFLSTITSTSTTTGGVILSGGAGIAKDVYIGGTVNIQNQTSATSTTTGALIVAGGVGISGDLYVRNIYSSGSLIGGGTGGGTALVVKDEGTVQNTATSILNFVGDGVIASTASTAEVIINIPGYPMFPTGDFGDLTNTTDAFGVSLTKQYDCMNPVGAMSYTDLNLP